MLENNIKSLIKILEDSNVDELEISTFWGRQKIRIRKNTSSNREKNIELPQDITTHPLNSPSQSIVTSKSEAEQIESIPKTEEVALINEEETVMIKAPLVGTYYAAPKSGESPFISEGDTIKEGQIICIIEAMKIFNEIESEISGKVIKLLIKDGTPVEYDQDLIVVAPE